MTLRCCVVIHQDILTNIQSSLLRFKVKEQKIYCFVFLSFFFFFFTDRCTYGGQNPGSVLTDIHGINSYDCYEFTSSQNKFLLAQNTKDELCRYQLEATLKQSNNYTILANIIFDFGARRNREDSYKCNVKVGENKNVSKLRMPDENCVCTTHARTLAHTQICAQKHAWGNNRCFLLCFLFLNTIK